MGQAGGAPRSSTANDRRWSENVTASRRTALEGDRLGTRDRGSDGAAGGRWRGQRPSPPPRTAAPAPDLRLPADRR